MLAMAHLKLALALLAGLSLPLAYAPFGHFYVAPLCFAVLILAWTRATPRQAALRGFAFGVASFLAGMYWIYISVHGFGGAHPALAAVITAALVVGLAAFPAAVGWVAARWFAVGGLPAWIVVLPSLWVIGEWCRGWMFSGLGWLAAGYSQSDSWLMGLAPVGGIYLMSWGVLVTAGGLVAMLRATGARRLVAVAVVVAVWFTGYTLAQRRWTRPDSTFVSVALAQGAVPQDLKWDPSEFDNTLMLYRELTAQAAGSDLIVWPEVAIPAPYERVEAFFLGVRSAAAQSAGTVLSGVLRRNPDTGSVQNALVALTNPPSFYVKRHLVPYGEYFPVPNFVRDWLRSMELPYSDISPGPPDQPPLQVGGQRLAITICYEDVFGAEQLHYMPEASLLVNVSNDAWFGDSIAPHQHLEIARVRAAEVGRYLLRATNTGITAIVDPSGRIVSSAPQFEPALLTGVVQGHEGSTPYVRWGNYAIVLAAVAMLVAARLWRGRG